MNLTPQDIRPTLQGGAGGRYEYMVGSLHVIFDQVYPHSNRTIDSWVEVRWTGNVPAPKLLHAARHDITGARLASTLAKSCRESLPSERAEWADIMEAVRYDVVRSVWDGKPSVQLADITAPETASSRWLVRPLVGGTGATSLIAPGGSTKSFIALACGIQVATGRNKLLGLSTQTTGPVLYLDWEADAHTHAERMRALCKPHDIPPPKNLWYNQESGPLYRSAAQRARFIEREGIVFVVVDSVMLARGGDAFGPEETVRLYAALRQLGVPVLLVDHKSREAIRKGHQGAYGSVVNDNSARLQWEIWPVVPLGQHQVAIKLEQTKRNNVGQLNPIGLHVTFTNDGDDLSEVRFKQVAPSNVVPFGLDEGHLRDEIEMVLRYAGEEGMFVKDIAEELDRSAAQIRRPLNQDPILSKKVTSTSTPTGTRWRLSEHDQQGEADLPDAF